MPLICRNDPAAGIIVHLLLEQLPSKYELRGLKCEEPRFHLRVVIVFTVVTDGAMSLGFGFLEASEAVEIFEAAHACA